MCHKIFVLDDSPADRISLRALFEDAGYQVETFATISELVKEISEKSTPDVLVVDYQLTEGNCLPVVARYRYKVPYIICATSSYDSEERLVKLYKAGVTDVQPKSFDIGLLCSVRTMMDRAKRGKHTETLYEIA